MAVVDEAVRLILGMPWAAVTEDGRRRRLARGDEADIEPGPFELPTEAQVQIEGMRPHPEEVLSAESDVLGSYLPMRSPGVITLHWQSIGSFFWHTILDMQCHGLYMEQPEVEAMAHVAVLKTHSHEVFHHFCDVARCLFGNAHDRLNEEALAVACSHHDIVEMRAEWRSKPARLSSLLYRELMRRIYAYRSPGYRDWVLFQTRPDFEQGLVQYLGPPSTAFLQRSGIDVATMLGAIRRSIGDQGTVERVGP